MKLTFTSILRIGISSFLLFTSCSSEFLELKPQKSMVILETLNDIEALLDNASVMNRTDYFKLISDGDLYLRDEKVTSISELDRNLYLWKKDYDPTGRNTGLWDLPYQQIFYANTAMETLSQMKNNDGNTQQWNTLFGRAIFYRAWAHYNLLQDFAEGYDPNAPYQLGVPIITDSRFPKEVNRANLIEVYDFILQDLSQAESLLPEKPDISTRPSLQALYAVQARVHQNLNEYDAALLSVQKALDIDKSLLDYNLLSFTGALPFSDYDLNTHPEVVFFTYSNSPFVAITGVHAEKELFSSYEDEDIRKQAYYNEDQLYTGTYSGNSLYQFTGLAIDELYLLKAECLVRLNKVDEGMEVVKEMLGKRYKNGALKPMGQLTVENALSFILKERQKELVGRGTRWTDLKRINREGTAEVDLKREYLAETFTLIANDSRYVFDIPRDELDISGLEPNNR